MRHPSTTKGSESAFRYVSVACQVLPSSRLMSEPLGADGDPGLRASSHCTAEPEACGGVVEAVQRFQSPSVCAAVLFDSFGLV